MRFERGQKPKEAMNVGMSKRVPKIVAAHVNVTAPNGRTETRRLSPGQTQLIFQSWENRDPELWRKHPADIYLTYQEYDRLGPQLWSIGKSNAMKLAEFHEYVSITGKYFKMPYWIERSRI